MKTRQLTQHQDVFRPSGTKLYTDNLSVSHNNLNSRILLQRMLFVCDGVKSALLRVHFAG